MADVRAAGIDVVLFVPPLSRCELEVIEQTGELARISAWRRQLVEPGPTGTSRDTANWSARTRSFSTSLTSGPRWVTSCCAGFSERLPSVRDAAEIVRDAGVWVDAATVDAHLAQQEAARMRSRQGSDRCVGVVERMRRARAGGAAAEGAKSAWRPPAPEAYRHRAGDGRRLITPVVGWPSSSVREAWPGEARAAVCINQILGGAACSRPLPDPAVSPAGHSQGGRTLAHGRPARQGPARAGMASGRGR